MPVELRLFLFLREFDFRCIPLLVLHRNSFIDFPESDTKTEQGSFGVYEVLASFRALRRFILSGLRFLLLLVKEALEHFAL